MSASSAYAPARRSSSMSLGGDQRSRSGTGNAIGLAGMVLIAVRFWRDKVEGLQVFQSLESRLKVIYSRSRASLRPLIQFLIRWVALLHTKLLEFSAPQNGPESAQQNGRATDGLRGAGESTCFEVSSSEDYSVAKPDCSALENHKKIDEVLHYWFGQYTPDESQKKLWMISSQSDRLRKQVDQEIHDKFSSLLSVLVTEELLDEWCTDRDRYGYKGKVAAIIVLDQFSRHIRRYYEESDGKTSFPLPKQIIMDGLAFQTAKHLMKDHAMEIQACMIPMPMYVFSLMPYRHQSTLDTVGLVQRLIDHSNNLWTECDGMLRRFRKATNRRMAILQDKDRQKGDTQKTEYTDEDILECFPFDANMSAAESHPVVQTICSFLGERGVHPSKVKSGKTASGPVPVIVSLSGGVDSMVIADALVFLNNSMGYNLKIVAVHIDYANRPDSGAESDYVKRFCESSDIEFSVRRIDELTRGVTNRDEYEKQTRNIRYGMYRDTVTKHSNSFSGEIGVFLGHHRGDLRENVLSNAHKGCGPLDLSGMTPVSVNDRVTLYRPLLPLEKTAVFDYAHQFGVPYFKDTTPHWSTRGKLRNRLLPLLEEIYGEGSMNNLSTLAVESDDCRTLVYQILLEPFLSAVTRRPMGISFETGPWRDQGHFFWKFVLREALHSAGLGMWSDKAVESFLERVLAKQPKAAWLQCRRDYAVHLEKGGRVHVFYPQSFPFRKRDAYELSELTVEYTDDLDSGGTRVGPWLVSTSWKIMESMKSLEKEIEIDKPAVVSLEAFMGGHIEYCVRVPTWVTPTGEFEPRPLVFRKFDKPSRPRAWKAIDTKIQETIPMVGNDADALLGLKDPRAAGCTHKNDKGKVVVNSTKVARVTIRLIQD